MKKKFGTDYFLIAHVDLSQVQFGKEKELRFDYIHEIDDWDTIALNLRQKKKKSKPRREPRRPSPPTE